MAISDADLAAFHALELPTARMGTAQTTQNGKKKGRGGTATSFISEGGALGGAAAGAAIGSIVPIVGTAIGGIIGGGLGAFGGRLAENKIRDDEFRVGDAAKEGALTTVLSGPGKLLKGGLTAGKALKGGLSLEEALMAGASKASAKTGIGKIAGEKLQGGADNLATRALKLNNSTFNTEFHGKTGEEVGQFATRLGLVGKTAPEIMTKVYEPAQKVYQAGLESIGGISKESVVKSVQETIGKLAKSSFSEKRDLAQKITAQADELLAKYGDEIPATELNALKNEAYDMVDKSITDKAGKFDNNIYDILGNSFRKSINAAADKSGVTIDPAVLKKAGINFKSTSLGDFGHELRALNDLTKQIDVKSRVGKGSSVFGLTKSTGTIAGGTIGGPVGAGLGMAGATLVNSPKFTTAATKLMDGVGGKLAGGAAGQIGIPGAMAGAARGATGASLTESLMSAQGQPQFESGNMTDSANASSMNPMAPNTMDMNSLSQTGGDLSSGMDTQAQSPYSRENLMYDIQRDPQNAAKYIDYYKELSSIFETAAPKGLNSTASGVVADTQTGLQALGDLYNSIGESGANNPVIGQLRGLNPLDTEAKNLQGHIATAKQIVGKALEGGVLRKEDEAKYAKILPTMNDTDAVAQEKIKYLYGLISQRLSQYQSNLQPGNSLEDTLMQAQGAY